MEKNSFIHTFYNLDKRYDFVSRNLTSLLEGQKIDFDENKLNSFYDYNFRSLNIIKKSNNQFFSDFNKNEAPIKIIKFERNLGENSKNYFSTNRSDLYSNKTTKKFLIEQILKKVRFGFNLFVKKNKERFNEGAIKEFAKKLTSSKSCRTFTPKDNSLESKFRNKKFLISQSTSTNFDYVVNQKIPHTLYEKFFDSNKYNSGKKNVEFCNKKTSKILGNFYLKKRKINYNPPKYKTRTNQLISINKTEKNKINSNSVKNVILPKDEDKLSIDNKNLISDLSKTFKIAKLPKGICKFFGNKKEKSLNQKKIKSRSLSSNLLLNFPKNYESLPDFGITIGTPKFLIKGPFIKVLNTKKNI